MKQYLVIGMGRFGASVAKTLYESNEDVLAIDVDEDIIQESINNNIVENALVLDATDESHLKGIGIEGFDLAFVCIGAIEPSIMVTLNLKEMGVKKIIVKAISKRHGKVLEKIGATQVIYPEEYMGRRVAMLAMEPNMIEHLRFSQDFLLVEIKAPTPFWGKNLIELDVRNKYNVNIVGIKKEDQSFKPNPSADTIIEQGDVLLVITDSKTADYLENLK
ncbi:MAG: TrkA family potassium uptake protein [Cetobacterium sp.]|uniref:potassium channel family protein n=1 Tax=unclassified Cetobacterium TaxID=2630983 RepID=UPI00163BE0B5|nr:TrkA family potassium uptake protein [Cetobacterium sp. 2A]MBC2856581.1 TrkA family potassium uptake protein [Cetobacterium sp. 2A]